MISSKIQYLQRLAEVSNAQRQLRKLVASSKENAKSLGLADALWKAFDLVVANVQVLESWQGKYCLRNSLQLICVYVKMLDEALLANFLRNLWDFIV